jgi:4-hydroxybenzoate polyprenyltransferase/phosphoglycolate phosphatase-like HAD superfamily hydrolase
MTATAPPATPAPEVLTATPAAASSAPGLPPLVVDLDGTLIQTDLLFESLWRALAQGPRAALAFAGQAVRGRAALKAHLADVVSIDPAGLPYDQGVLELVRAAREAGRTTVLCTASDQKLARGVAAHLGLFDDVHGSDGVRNLKGTNKAAFLVERFGEGGFDYVGDALADRAVWSRARAAISIGLPAAARAGVTSAGGVVQHIDRPGAGLKPYVKAMRPHQWLKNILVFLPVLAAHNFTLAAWGAAMAAFVAFSLVASSVYFANDMLDLDADRAHPRKRNRPFAAGTASLAVGTVMTVLLLLAGFGIGLLVGEPRFLAVLGFYFVLTTAYSLSLKRKLVIDICTLAGLYTLRVIAGAAATGVPLSEWLLGFSVFFFLSLAAVKRQAELVDGLASGRSAAAGRAYRTDDLPIVSQMAIAAGYAAVLEFALYLNSSNVLKLYHSPKFLWGISPVLLFWISRMVMRAHRGGMTDDPIIFAVRDRISHYCGAIILGLVLAAALT